MGRKSCHLIAWEKVCQPKDCGGSGIKSLRGMNSALLMKLGLKRRIICGLRC